MAIEEPLPFWKTTTEARWLPFLTVNPALCAVTPFDTVTHPPPAKVEE
jgi:hypothetical protein